MTSALHFTYPKIHLFKHIKLLNILYNYILQNPAPHLMRVKKYGFSVSERPRSRLGMDIEVFIRGSSATTVSEASATQSHDKCIVKKTAGGRTWKEKSWLRGEGTGGFR